MSIDKKEVLRYLSYKNQYIDEKLNNLIDECIVEIKSISKPKYVYDIFNINKDNGYILENTNFTLEGENIKEHLKDSTKCVVMVATLGSMVDYKIRYYEKINLTKALILDACATTYIEYICDRIEEEIKEIARNEGKNITFRYSPGYGDFSIEVQNNILNILDGNKRVGVTATESSILIPRKSVTALIGFQIKEKKNINKCLSCNKYESCSFRHMKEIN
ncbi:MAG: methionine synthase [Anaeromicrobium sp.]|jgi:hypothetical protein|uniref:vitamin B12 dependent-methionine synthase activation domain-containing protein n=1 Tax=Anaeromicrobium sp. TaxID=1929132 RepID=UPI0025D642E5|nr:vitamin B12 dependent-methionine synthase activation domain-containing protein [Anaeromicrobium sp.]MCT4593664.1 methionine synthase [Anaeromicrobium sp.]